MSRPETCPTAGKSRRRFWALGRCLASVSIRDRIKPQLDPARILGVYSYMSDKEYTEKEYRETVELHAREALSREKEGGDINDAIHEEADGSAWVIYTYRARLVLQYSKNEDAILDEIGFEGFSGADSMAEIYTRAAFFALRQDIAEKAEELREEEPEEAEAE